MKPNQGIVSSCDHINHVTHPDDEEDSNKENVMNVHVNVKRPNYCLSCLKRLNVIAEKNSSDSNAMSGSLPLVPVAHVTEEKLSPLVSISVVDADNLNVCMCNILVEDHHHHANAKLSTNDKLICPICRNLIKQQPNERCTLVSKRTMLGDVVVNRIDSQYLSSNYSTTQSLLKKLQDPYTPESLESHSPQPETELEDKDYLINETLDSEDILENLHELKKHKVSLAAGNGVPEVVHPNGESFKEGLEEKANNNNNNSLYNHTHIVSPSQLTSRLEILRRESHLQDPGSIKSGSGSDIETKESLNKSKKCCLRCSCVIL